MDSHKAMKKSKQTGILRTNLPEKSRYFIQGISYSILVQRFEWGSVRTKSNNIT